METSTLAIAIFTFLGCASLITGLLYVRLLKTLVRLAAVLLSIAVVIALIKSGYARVWPTGQSPRILSQQGCTVTVAALGEVKQKDIC